MKIAIIKNPDGDIVNVVQLPYAGELAAETLVKAAASGFDLEVEVFETISPRDFGEILAEQIRQREEADASLR